MIALDSPEWGHLRHAYGAASDIPGLLNLLGGNPQPIKSYQGEPWHSLWSALCHQGDIYSASYAAVPHIVRICLATVGPIDNGFFLLPACIEVARARNRGPAITADMKEPYFNALRGLHECAYRHSTDHWDADMTQSVAAAIAAAKKQIDLAEALCNLDDDLIAKLVSLDF